MSTLKEDIQAMVWEDALSRITAFRDAGFLWKWENTSNEMAQWLRELNAFVEDLGLVRNSHGTAHDHSSLLGFDFTLSYFGAVETA